MKKVFLRGLHFHKNNNFSSNQIGPILNDSGFCTLAWSASIERKDKSSYCVGVVTCCNWCEMCDISQPNQSWQISCQDAGLCWAGSRKAEQILPAKNGARLHNIKY